MPGRWRRPCEWSVVSEELGRPPTVLADIARFAVAARRVADRGRDRFVDPDDDDQRRIASSLVIDEKLLWQAVSEEFPTIVAALLPE